VIKLSIKGLADFMTASPARQRRILRDYKRLDEDEPTARRLYYKESRDLITAFHRNSHEIGWLSDRAELLKRQAATATPASAIRLRHNVRAVRLYERNFGSRSFEPLNPVRLNLEFYAVRISVVPDLHILEEGKEKLVKLDFGVKAPEPQLTKIISQATFEAAAGHVRGLTSSSILYLDVARGKEYRGARAGARTMREIEAACLNIAALWDGI
jgi:hypothetical protein